MQGKPSDPEKWERRIDGLEQEYDASHSDPENQAELEELYFQLSGLIGKNNLRYLQKYTDRLIARYNIDPGWFYRRGREDAGRRLRGWLGGLPRPPLWHQRIRNGGHQDIDDDAADNQKRHAARQAPLNQRHDDGAGAEGSPHIKAGLFPEEKKQSQTGYHADLDQDKDDIRRCRADWIQQQRPGDGHRNRQPQPYFESDGHFCPILSHLSAAAPLPGGAAAYSSAFRSPL